MPIYDLQDLVTYKERGRRLMGIDLGEKRIGVAISDPNWCIASPVIVLKRTDRNSDLASIIHTANRYHAVGIVVGWPVNMNGSFGPQSEKMRGFARSLAELSDLVIALWDERLSTAAVNRTLLEADMSRKRRGEVIDKLAATYILQGALDRLKTLEPSGVVDRRF